MICQNFTHARNSSHGEYHFGNAAQQNSQRGFLLGADADTPM
jgi:hypothetical protein